MIDKNIFNELIALYIFRSFLFVKHAKKLTYANEGQTWYVYIVYENANKRMTHITNSR